jgi:hypothetical protein
MGMDVISVVEMEIDGVWKVAPDREASYIPSNNPRLLHKIVSSVSLR